MWGIKQFGQELADTSIPTAPCWVVTQTAGTEHLARLQWYKSLDLCEAFYKTAHSSSPLRGNIAYCRFTVPCFPDSFRLVQPSLSH